MNDIQYFTKVSNSIFFHDLRAQEDDKEVLTNPHKGWYFHYYDNGGRFMHYRDTLKEGDFLHWMPGLDHMYFRFDWSDIEKEEGVYDWSELDDAIAKWGKEGYHFALRLCTFESNRPTIPYATPKWVFDAGAEGIPQHRVGSKLLLGTPEDVEFDLVEPVYSDPIYLEKLANFMKEYGRHFNKHPLVDFIDFGTFGTWGEGHTTSGSCREYPLSMILQHLNMHLENFPDMRIILPTDTVHHLSDQSKKDARFFLAYCKAQNIGLRCDSAYVKGYVESYGFDMMKQKTAFDLFWKEAPIDVEWAHINLRRDSYDGGFKGLETMKHLHTTYMGFHGDPYEWFENNKAVHEMIANRLGYWYFIEGYELPEKLENEGVLAGDACENEGEWTSKLNAKMDNPLRIYVENRGVAPAYNIYTSEVYLKDEAGKMHSVFKGEIDNRTWMPEELNSFVMTLKTSDLATGTYELYYGLFDRDHRPVKFAMKKERRTEEGLQLLGKVELQ